MSMINPEIKKLWVDALRSGQYQQGFRHLRKHDTFCCLGVLCDLHTKHATEYTLEVVKSTTNGVYFYDGLMGQLPTAVIRWIESKNGWYLLVRIDGNYASLETHNDEFQVPFNRIADAIEEQL